jgi:pyrrolidone-carboxylate peptidase
MGVKNEVEYINISTTAKNMMSSDIPDNSKRIFKDKKIDEKLPEKIILDSGHLNFIRDRWDSNGIKYKIEKDADTYVCNSLLFAGIDEARKNEKVLFYFFHVPHDIYENKEKLRNLEDAIKSLF